MIKSFLLQILILGALIAIMGDVRDIGICCWNCRGYQSSIPYIRELNKDHEVIGICEHWLHNNKLNLLKDLSTSHAVHARSSRHSNDEAYGSKRGQGGGAIFWPKDISGFSPITDIIHDRICGVRFQDITGRVVIFLCIYMPAQGSCDILEECLEELSEVIETREVGASVVVLGDFNGDIASLGGERSKSPPTTQGIHGLTTYACCVIFWSIVIPIATFGCELWIIDEKCLKILEAFQMYIGRRIQRLFMKSPNMCAYFPLGWIRIERFIEIKKLMFIQTIMCLDNANPTKVVFIQRAKAFF